MLESDTLRAFGILEVLSFGMYFALKLCFLNCNQFLACKRVLKAKPQWSKAPKFALKLQKSMPLMQDA